MVPIKRYRTNGCNVINVNKIAKHIYKPAIKRGNSIIKNNTKRHMINIFMKKRHIDLNIDCIKKEEYICFSILFGSSPKYICIFD